MKPKYLYLYLCISKKRMSVIKSYLANAEVFTSKRAALKRVSESKWTTKEYGHDEYYRYEILKFKIN